MNPWCQPKCEFFAGLDRCNCGLIDKQLRSHAAARQSHVSNNDEFARTRTGRREMFRHDVIRGYSRSLFKSDWLSRTRSQ